MKKILPYLLVGIVALAAGYYFGVSREPSESYVAPTATSTPPVAPRATTQRVSDRTSVYIIDGQYPHFGIAPIDTRIDSIVNGIVSEFKTYPANPPEMASPQNELTIRYEAPYIGADVISFKLIVSEYTGGAHPNSIFSGINFDRETGKQLTLEDVLKMINRTVQQVSVSATAQLKAKLGDAMFMEGADTNPENFSSFLVSENKVTFIFQPYQVAAYAAGVQEVSFQRIQ